MQLHIQDFLQPIDCPIHIEMVVKHIAIGLFINLLGKLTGWVENIGLQVPYVVNYTLGVGIVVKTKEASNDLLIVNILKDLTHGIVICIKLLCEKLNHILVECALWAWDATEDIELRIVPIGPVEFSQLFINIDINKDSWLSQVASEELKSNQLIIITEWNTIFIIVILVRWVGFVILHDKLDCSIHSIGKDVEHRMWSNEPLHCLLAQT